MDHLPTIAHADVHVVEPADVPFEDEATIMQDQALTHDDITEVQTDAHAAARVSAEHVQGLLYASAPADQGHGLRRIRGSRWHYRHEHARRRLTITAHGGAHARLPGAD